MPRFVSEPTKPPWNIVVKCENCKWRYAYFAEDIVKGENCAVLSQPSVYCGHCKYVNFVTGRVPRKILDNAQQI